MHSALYHIIGLNCADLAFRGEFEDIKGPRLFATKWSDTKTVTTLSTLNENAPSEYEGSQKKGQPSTLANTCYE